MLVPQTPARSKTQSNNQHQEEKEKQINLTGKGCHEQPHTTRRWGTHAPKNFAPVVYGPMILNLGLDAACDAVGDAGVCWLVAIDLTAGVSFAYDCY